MVLVLLEVSSTNLSSNSPIFTGRMAVTTQKMLKKTCAHSTERSTRLKRPRRFRTRNYLVHDP